MLLQLLTVDSGCIKSGGCILSMCIAFDSAHVSMDAVIVCSRAEALYDSGCTARRSLCSMCADSVQSHQLCTCPPTLVQVCQPGSTTISATLTCCCQALDNELDDIEGSMLH
jgi:hypothetical protein